MSSAAAHVEAKLARMLASAPGESWTIPAGRLVRTDAGWCLRVATPRDIARVFVDGTMGALERLGFMPIHGELVSDAPPAPVLARLQLAAACRHRPDCPTPAIGYGVVHA